jgi:decaprenylphospho-beta-D-ribofuranose 2-oxidase
MTSEETSVSLSGWGRSAHRRSIVRKPTTDAELVDAVQSAGQVTVRGAGCSYGDAALPGQGIVIDLTARNRVLSFDGFKGVVVVETGVTLGDLMDQVLPLGWSLPVLPGSARITVGGALASDVHGKNHPGAGSFGQHVLWLSLLDSEGNIAELSAGRDPDGFWATLGGMGLTGVILTAAIQLQPVQTGWARQKRRRTHSLDETIAVLHELAARQETDPDLHVVAWLDTHNPGPRLGRAVIDESQPAQLDDLPRGVPPDPDRRRSTSRRPIRSLPGSGVVFGPTIAAASLARWHLAGAGDGRLLPLMSALCPLDRADAWPAAFGKGGLVQYQFAIPSEATPVLRQVLAFLVGSRMSPALTTLKNLGFGTAGPLSFPLHGWTLAADLPARWLRDGRTLRTIDAMVAEAGGRIYLAKDSTVDPDLLPQMYPRLKTWQRTRDRLDPDRRFTSALSERLHLLP